MKWPPTHGTRLWTCTDLVTRLGPVPVLPLVQLQQHVAAGQAVRERGGRHADYRQLRPGHLGGEEPPQLQVAQARDAVTATAARRRGVAQQLGPQGSAIGRLRTAGASYKVNAFTGPRVRYKIWKDSEVESFKT